jgi:hypothetical protein
MQTWGFRLSRGWSSLGRFGRYLWWSSGRDELVGHILGGGWPADIPAGGGAGDWIGPESADGLGVWEESGLERITLIPWRWYM